MTAKPRAVVVVVPAHNESVSLPACLESLQDAAANVAAPVAIVVVLDDCHDDSAKLVGRYGDAVHFVQVYEHNVGAARAAGFRYARVIVDVPHDQTWYATTDADTQVSCDWLSRQLGSGLAVVCGVVSVPHWRHHPAEVADRYRARYDSDEPGHRHIHGANMGFRASAYWDVGGFASRASGEDVDHHQPRKLGLCSELTEQSLQQTGHPLRPIAILACVGAFDRTDYPIHHQLVGDQKALLFA